MEIEFHPLADREVRKSHRWYLKQSAKAARRFLEAVEKAVAESQPLLSTGPCTCRALASGACAGFPTS
jgi:hypothetical protein